MQLTMRATSGMSRSLSRLPFNQAPAPQRLGGARPGGATFGLELRGRPGRAVIQTMNANDPMDGNDNRGRRNAITEKDGKDYNASRRNAFVESVDLIDNLLDDDTFLENRPRRNAIQGEPPSGNTRRLAIDVTPPFTVVPAGANLRIYKRITEGPEVKGGMPTFLRGPELPADAVIRFTFPLKCEMGHYQHLALSIRGGRPHRVIKIAKDPEHFIRATIALNSGNAMPIEDSEGAWINLDALRKNLVNPDTLAKFKNWVEKQGTTAAVAAGLGLTSLALLGAVLGPITAVATGVVGAVVAAKFKKRDSKKTLGMLAPILGLMADKAKATKIMEMYVKGLKRRERIEIGLGAGMSAIGGVLVPAQGLVGPLGSKAISAGKEALSLGLSQKFDKPVVESLKQVQGSEELEILGSGAWKQYAEWVDEVEQELSQNL